MSILEDTNIMTTDAFAEMVLGTQPTTTVEPTEETQEPTVETIATQTDIPLASSTPIVESIQILIDNELWEDTPLKYNEKEYETIADLLKDNPVDEDLFQSMVALQKDIKNNKIKENYISVKDKDDTKVKLASAILEGIEYSDLVQYQSAIIDPMESMDFSTANETDVEDFVRAYLIDNSNIPDKYIEAEIADFKKEYKLVEKAEEFRATLRNSYQEEIQNRTTALLEHKKQTESDRREGIKNLRKDMKDSNFSSTFIDKAVQLRYDTDDSGNSHYITLINNKIKEDKEFEKNLLHMLLDPTDFESKIKAPVKQESVKKILELANVVPKAKGGSLNTQPPTNLNEADSKFLSMFDLK